MSRPDHINAWAVEYLLPYPANNSAIPDAKARGWFSHKEILMAATKEQVISEIMRKGDGATPVSIELQPKPHPFFDRVTNEYRQQFLLALLFSVQSGISPGRALESLIEQETGPMRIRLNIGLDLLRRGRSFLEAISALNIFDETTLSIIDSGEEMGKLPQALGTASDHLSKHASSNKLLFGAVAWTMLDIVFSVTSILSTRFGLIPSLKESPPKGSPEKIAEFEKALQLATNANDAMLVLTSLILLVVMACVITYTGRNVELRNKMDEFMLKMPLIRDVMLHGAFSTTAAVMSSLLKGGVSFLPATEIARRGVKIAVISAYWESVKTRVETGESVARALCMPPLDMQEQMIVQNHRDVNQLSKSFLTIANNREERAKKAAKKFGLAAFVSSMLYSGLSVVMTLFVIYVQNEGAMSTGMR